MLGREWSSTPSITAVRQNPALTENRRDIVDGLNRRTSRIERMYNASCARLAASASRSRSAHHERKQRKSEYS